MVQLKGHVLQPATITLHHQAGFTVILPVLEFIHFIPVFCPGTTEVKTPPVPSGLTPVPFAGQRWDEQTHREMCIVDFSFIFMPLLAPQLICTGNQPEVGCLWVPTITGEDKQRCSQGSPVPRGRGFTVAEWPHGLVSHGTPTVWDSVGPPHHETKGQLCRDILESLRLEHQFYLSLNSKLYLPHNPASRQMSVYLSVPKLVPEKEKKKKKKEGNSK